METLVVKGFSCSFLLIELIIKTLALLFSKLDEIASIHVLGFILCGSLGRS